MWSLLKKHKYNKIMLKLTNKISVKIKKFLSWIGMYVKKKNKQIKPTHLENIFLQIKYKQKEEIIVVKNWKITIEFKPRFKNNAIDIRKI